MAHDVPTESKPQLWQTPQPPLPSGPYQPDKSLAPDIDAVLYGLHVFLGSHMHESEDFCRQYDPKM